MRDLEIQLCRSLPTKAETHACLLDLKAKEDHISHSMAIIMVIPLIFIVGLFTVHMAIKWMEKR